MNQDRRTGTKYHLQREAKTDNTEGGPLKKSMKSDVGNDSFKYSHESRVSGHSTPIGKKDYTLEAEDSSAFDYHCSPISFPCTQDGGNEIAWDWQTSVSKSSSEKANLQNSLNATPKRPKQLHRKRNTNSPLLQKPLRRKQVKMENIENIGKLTAELKALTERMNSLKQNSENQNDIKESDTKSDCDSKYLIELDSHSADDAMLEVVNNNKVELKTTTMDNKNEKKSNYDDLFDDSIDDSMIKCSQEVEKRLHVGKSKSSETVDLSVIKEEKDLFAMSEIEIPHLTTTNSTENSKHSNNTKNSLTVNSSSSLKTYSNNSHRISSLCNSEIVNSRDSSSKKSLFNSSITNIQSGKHKLQSEKMSDFPDDSFDDCLASCIEDEIMSSKLSEYDFNASNTNHNTSHSKKSSKQTSSNAMNNKKSPSNAVSSIVGSVCNAKSVNHRKGGLISDDLPENTNVSDNKKMIEMFEGKSALENRKFFKTKSLSDQYFYQNKNFNQSSKASKMSTVGRVPSSSVSSSATRFQSNSDSSSVSNASSVVKSLYGGSNLSSNNGMGNARVSNRLEGEEGNDCTVKYKSTSNLCSLKEPAREPQPVRYTPEEIEKRRLEAKMRLEAKRKLQQNINIAGPSEVTMKKSVKR